MYSDRYRLAKMIVETLREAEPMVDSHYTHTYYKGAGYDVTLDFHHLAKNYTYVELNTMWLKVSERMLRRKAYGKMNPTKDVQFSTPNFKYTWIG